MSTRDILVVTDASGNIVAAHVPATDRSDISTFIAPADPSHKLHRVSDVPTQICEMTDPFEFHRTITEHFYSESAKVSPTSAEELNAVFHRALARQIQESASSSSSAEPTGR